jgi:hypothetical protein
MRERKSKRKKKGSRSRWGEKNRKREKRAREGKKKKNTKLLSRGRQQNTLEVEDDGSARNTSFPTTIPSWNRKHTGIEQQILEFSCEFLDPENSSQLSFKLRKCAELLSSQFSHNYSMLELNASFLEFLL